MKSGQGAVQQSDTDDATARMGGLQPLKLELAAVAGLLRVIAKVNSEVQHCETESQSNISFAVIRYTTTPRPVTQSAEKLLRLGAADRLLRSLDVLLEVLADDLKDICTTLDGLGSLLQEALDAVKSCSVERINAEVRFRLLGARLRTHRDQARRGVVRSSTE